MPRNRQAAQPQVQVVRRYAPDVQRQVAALLRLLTVWDGHTPNNMGVSMDQESQSTPGVVSQEQKIIGGTEDGQQ